MSKTAMIRARTDSFLKEEVEQIFKELGLTTTEAINLFFNQIRIRKGLPFDVVIPSNNVPTTATTTKRYRKKCNLPRNIKNFDSAIDTFNTR